MHWQVHVAHGRKCAGSHTTERHVAAAHLGSACSESHARSAGEHNTTSRARRAPARTGGAASARLFTQDGADGAGSRQLAPASARRAGRRTRGGEIRRQPHRLQARAWPVPSARGRQHVPPAAASSCSASRIAMRAPRFALELLLSSSPPSMISGATSRTRPTNLGNSMAFSSHRAPPPGPSEEGPTPFRMRQELYSY